MQIHESGGSNISVGQVPWKIVRAHAVLHLMGGALG